MIVEPLDLCQFYFSGLALCPRCFGPNMDINCRVMSFVKVLNLFLQVIVI